MVRRIIPWVIGALITGLYGYALVAPIGNLVGLPQLGLAINPIGWFWLVAGVLLPPLAYALALWAGRGRAAATRLLALGTGLAAVAVLQLEIQLLVQTSTFFG